MPATRFSTWAFHGKPRLHNWSAKDASNRLELMELADQLEGLLQGTRHSFRIVQHAQRQRPYAERVPPRTGALAVLGFKREVDWLASAAFDTLVLGYLQGVSFTASGMRKLRRLLEENALDLSKKLEFRMWPAQD